MGTYTPTAYLRMLENNSPLLGLNLYYDGEKINLQDAITELSVYDSTEQVLDDINAFLNGPAKNDTDIVDEDISKQTDNEPERPVFTGLPDIPINARAVEVMESAEKINNNKLLILKRR